MLNNRRGYSIVEIMIIVAILGLIATVSVPFYRAAALNLTLSGAARDLASDLRLAQQQAVTTQINHSVAFNQAANTYAVINASTGAVIKSSRINSQIFIQSINSLANDTVTYNATGAATATGSVILSNPGGKTATIEIKPSGYVEIR